MKSIRSFFPYIMLVLMAIACNRSGNTQQSGGGENGGGNGATGNAQDSILNALNQMIAADPGNYINYLNRARYYSDLGKYGLAIDDINRAVGADSTKGDIYLFKGDMFFKREMYTESYDAYKQCLHFDPQNGDAHLKKAGIDIVLGNIEEARNHINEALRINEYNPYAYFMRGRLYKALGDTSLAASSYKTAIEVDPNYYDAYIEVGLLYAAMKNDLAREYYTSAIQIQPRSIEAWYDKAMYLQETGFRKKDRYREAFACYDSIKKIEPLFFAADFNKGFIFLEYLGNYDSAAVYFTKAIQIHPQYHQAYYNRGLAMESLGRKKEAEQDYRAALSIQPDYTDCAKALNRLLK